MFGAQPDELDQIAVLETTDHAKWAVDIVIALNLIEVPFRQLRLAQMTPNLLQPTQSAEQSAA